MKTKKFIIAASLGLVIPLMSMGQTLLGPGVTGTSLTVAGLPHNFATQSWNQYVDAGHGEQICQPCHTPHNAKGSAAIMGAPLWNHDLSAGGYTLFSSINTAAGTMGVLAPDGTSKLCLSCHDGSVALGSFGGQTGTVYMSGYDGGLANLGTDLSNDHPISVDYANARTNGWGGLRNETTYQYSTWDPTTSLYMSTTKYTSSLLKEGKVQCTSCHGAHANSRGYQLGMNNGNRGSQLCLACHSK